MIRQILRWVAVLGVAAALSSPAQAYIDGVEIYHHDYETMGMLLTDNVTIALLRVERVDLETGRVRFDVAEWVKGKGDLPAIKHQLLKDGHVPDEFKNLKVGHKGVFFYGDPTGGERGVVFLEGVWYLVQLVKEDPTWWRIYRIQPQLKCTFMGTGDELAAALKKLAAEREVVVRCQKNPNSGASLYPVRYRLDPRTRRTLAPVSGQNAKQLLKETGSDVARLAEKLKDADPGMRGVAAEALGLLGSQAKSAVPALIQALADPEPVNRWTVAESLGSVGSDAQAAVPALVKALQEKYPMALWAAHRALPKIDREGRQIVPLVMSMLNSADPAVQNAAHGAVRAVGPNLKVTAATVLEALKDPRGLLWLGGMTVPSTPELAKAAVPTLTRALQDPDPQLRIAAMSVVKQLRVVDEVAPGLLAALRDANIDVRVAAMWAWCGSSKTTDVLAEVTRMLGQKEHHARSSALDALGWLGPRAEPAVPQIVEVLKSPEGYHRQLAATALGRICRGAKGESAKIAVAGLIGALKTGPGDAQHTVCAVASHSLAEIGPEARAAVPALLEIVREKDEDPYRAKTRLQAAYNAWRIDPSTIEVVLPYLLDVLRTSAQPRHRQRAIGVLGDLGPAAGPAIPALTEIAEAESTADEVRQWARTAIQKIRK